MIYVSGPMAGIPESNFPLFKRVVADLRRRGLEVVCPTECETCAVGSDEYGNYMRGDLIEMFRKCKSIALLPGWDNSQGATMEAMNALLLKFEFYEVKFASESRESEMYFRQLMTPPRERILAAFIHKWSGSFLG